MVVPQYLPHSGPQFSLTSRVGLPLASSHPGAFLVHTRPQQLALARLETRLQPLGITFLLALLPLIFLIADESFYSMVNSISENGEVFLAPLQGSSPVNSPLLQADGLPLIDTKTILISSSHTCTDNHLLTLAVGCLIFAGVATAGTLTYLL